jgi:hypothetical protein
MGLLGKTLDRVETYGKGQARASFSFAPNGSSDPVAASNKGMLLSSVVHTSTGTWTATLNCGGVKDIIAVFAFPQINSAANVDTSLQGGATINTGGSAITVVIRNNPGGSVADIAADASNRINVELVLQKGAVK